MSGWAPASPTNTPPRIGLWIFAAVFLLVSLYVLRNIDRGWVPHDEGTLAQPAARVLQGQLPHRDFDDMYTGGQALYHAAVFRLLGTRLTSLRAALFVGFLVTLPLLWYLSTRAAGYVAAAVTVLLAAAWSIPVYPAAMPSWYNLFLAVGAVAACARYLETRRWRWLTIAGVCAGLSITVKVSGFYLLAALLLFVVYEEQERTRRLGTGADPTSERGRLYSGFVTLGLVAFVGVVAMLIRSLTTPATALHFVLPPVALAGLLVWREWLHVPAVDGRLRRLLGAAVALLAGVAAPVAAFLVPYVLTRSVGELFHGVFVLPTLRFSAATRLPPGPLSFIPLLGLLALAAWARASRRRELIAVVPVGLLLVVGLVLGNRPAVYRAAWWLLLPLIPVLAIAGSVLLASSTLSRGTPTDDGAAAHDADAVEVDGSRLARDQDSSLLFLLLSATVMVSLVQFPTSAPVYFFYVAPLAAVLALALVSSLPRPPWALAGVVAGFHVLFAVMWIHPGWIYQMGDYFAAHPPTERLALERGGLRIVRSERLEMEGLVDLLDRVAPGRTIWVTPDAPEVYFLTERRNPTRTLFDFFEDQNGRQERILSMLDREDVGAIVFNTGPARFSSLPSVEFQREIAALYPQFTTVGRFLVRWKGSEREGAR